MPLAFLVSGVVGIAIERSLIRWLYGRPLETLLATWGLSLVLQQAVRSMFGANNLDVDTPGWMSGDMHLGGLTLTLNRLYIILFAIIVLAALMAALRFTPLGLRMRAVTQNRLHGRGDGHPHAVDRCADLRPGVRRRGHRRRGAAARSTTSRPTSGRATSSTASWSWCSAASAICGAPWLAR